MKNKRGEFIVSVILMTVMFFSFVYIDLISTQRHGILLWDALFQGKLFDYYKMCELVYTGNDLYHVNMSAHYDFTLYLIFAIWNFPCWVYEKISGANVQEIGFFLLWGKALVALAFGAVVRETILLYRRLSNGIRKEKEEETVLILMLSSVLLLTYTIGTGNYDVLSLVFILRGVRHLAEEKRKSFLIDFALAFSMKYFAILVFVPILLLWEKKLRNIFFDLLAVVSLSLIEKILFMSRIYLHRDQSVEGQILDGMLQTLAESGIVNALGLGSVSLLGVFFGALCLWSYFVDKQKANLRNTLRVGLVAWSIFFLIADYSQYWIVLMVPFLILCMVDGAPSVRATYPWAGWGLWLLESVFSIGILLNGVMKYEWVLATDSAAHTPLYFIVNRLLLHGRELVTNHSYGGVLKHANATLHFEPFLNAIILVSLLGILFLIGKSEKENCEIITEAELRLRMAAQLGAFALPLLYYVAITI